MYTSLKYEVHKKKHFQKKQVDKLRERQLNDIKLHI